jgi:hypothetical protein
MRRRPGKIRGMTGFAEQMRAGDGDCRRGLWLTFLSPFGLELAGGCGAAWIGIDVQHGDLDIADVAPLARVSPVPVLVRLASHDEAQLARVLDAGVDGVIVPAVESAGQAAELVQAAYFPPRGRRSMGLARVSLLGRRDQPLLLPMVETRAGLDHLDDILGVDGGGRRLCRALRPRVVARAEVGAGRRGGAGDRVRARPGPRAGVASPGSLPETASSPGCSRPWICSAWIPTPPPCAPG